MSKYDLGKMRDGLRKQINARKQDPTEFVPAKPKDKEELKYRVFILPPLIKGDKCHGGIASETMETYSLKNGVHYVNKKPYPCPRTITGDDCPMCQTGFDLAKDLPTKEERAAIFKVCMPSNEFLVNLYFPPISPNPEELHNKVLWYGAPKTIYDMWYEASFRENFGDALDPQAYGAFFDEENALIFNLIVKVGNGGFNDYKSSKFSPQLNNDRSDLQFVPIAKNSESIQAILDKRIDLYTKITQPDYDSLNKLVSSMLNGGDSGYDHDEAPPKAPPKTTTPPPNDDEEVLKQFTRETPKETPKETVKEQAKEPPKAPSQDEETKEVNPSVKSGKLGGGATESVDDEIQNLLDSLK